MAYHVVGSSIMRGLTLSGGRALVQQTSRTHVVAPAASFAALGLPPVGKGLMAAISPSSTTGEKYAALRQLLGQQVLTSVPHELGTSLHQHSGVEATLTALGTLGKPSVDALVQSLARLVESGALHQEDNEEDNEDSLKGRLVLPCMFPVLTLTASRPSGPALAAEAATWFHGLRVVAPNVPDGRRDEGATIFTVSGGHAARIDELRYRNAAVGDLPSLLKRASKPHMRNEQLDKGGKVTALVTPYHLQDTHRQILMESGAALGRAIATYGERAIIIDPTASSTVAELVSVEGGRRLRFEWNLQGAPFSALGILLAYYRIARSAVLTAVGGADGRAVMAALMDRNDEDQYQRVLLASAINGLSPYELSVMLVAGAEQYACLWFGISQALALQAPIHPVGDVFFARDGGVIVAREHVHALEAAIVPGLRGDSFEPCDLVASVKRVVGDGLYVPQRAVYVPDSIRKLPRRGGRREIYIRPGAVHSVVGYSHAGKTTFSREVCQLMRSEHGDRLKVVLIDCVEPLHDAPTGALASALFDMDVEVVRIDRVHPGLIDMIQLHLLEQWPDHHIVLIIDSATGLLAEALGGGSGAVGASESGVNPLARAGLAALSRLVHPRLTTMAIYNVPSKRDPLVGYWPQVHGASTLAYLLDKGEIIGFRDRIARKMFQIGEAAGFGSNMIGEYVSRTSTAHTGGIGDDTRYSG